MAYDNIKIEKGLYTSGKSFTRALEELDPSQQYEGTPLEGLDAYERQLKRFNIKVSGKDCDTVSKFFKTTDSAALFPEFVARSVNLGMKDDSTVEKIIATTTYIDSLDYRSLTLDDEDLTSFEAIAEGAELESAEIKVNDNLTTLQKFGKIISASYEAIKFQKLDVFSIALKRIGQNLMYKEFNAAVNCIPSDKIKTITASGSSITYDDLVNMWTSVSPYTLTTLIVSPNTYAQLLKMDEFKDSNAGLDFHGTGNKITPFGAEIVCKLDMEDNAIIALDKNYAIERVVASEVTTEFDKLINCQLERAAISTIVGFNPLFTDAFVYMTVSD